MDITGIGSVADFAKGLVDRFFPPDATAEQKLEATKAMAEEVARRDEAKASIIVAEMNQGDNYTKRARPTVVYAGLVMIFINYVLFPLIARIASMFLLGEDGTMSTEITNLLKPLDLPAGFWTAWGGVVGTWVLGRSMEKRGASGNLGKIASLITGNRPQF